MYIKQNKNERQSSSASKNRNFDSRSKNRSTGSGESAERKTYDANRRVSSPNARGSEERKPFDTSRRDSRPSESDGRKSYDSNRRTNNPSSRSNEYGKSYDANRRVSSPSARGSEERKPFDASKRDSRPSESDGRKSYDSNRRTNNTSSRSNEYGKSYDSNKRPTSTNTRSRDDHKEYATVRYLDRDTVKNLDGKVVKVKCERIDSEGKGIANYKGIELHVPNLLIEEEADVRLNAYRSHVEASIVNIIAKSKKRVNCKCRVFNNCGGCQLLHISYNDQLEFKNEYVKKQFSELRIRDLKIENIIGMDKFDHYRHKNQIVFGVEKNGKVVSGFYEEDSHKIVNYDECLIQHTDANRIMVTIKNLILKYRILPYNEDSGQGLLRHVLIRVGEKSKELMVVLVCATEMFPGRKDFILDLRNAHPEITTIIQNVNDEDTSMVLGKKERILYGKGYIFDELCDLKFQISPASFYQINPVQTQRLYNTALEFADLSGSEIVLDAYCGIGTIGLIASGKAKEVIGVELNQDAFKDAIRNTKLNDINNAYFYNNDATKFIESLVQEEQQIDVVFMDPPRSGSTPEFISSLSKLRATKIVYVSCNVETLVRDLKLIQSIGYHIEKVQPVDLFPHTKHIEVVIQMTYCGDKAK